MKKRLPTSKAGAFCFGKIIFTEYNLDNFQKTEYNKLVS